MNSLKIHGSRSFMRVATTRSPCKEWTYLRVKSVADDRLADLAHVMDRQGSRERQGGGPHDDMNVGGVARERRAFSGSRDASE